jgi:uncharacterized protein with von Willebrand factor type A (vWA) domain
MKEAGPDFVKKQLRETRCEYYELADRLVEIAPHDVQQAAQLLRRLVRETAESLDS